MVRVCNGSMNQEMESQDRHHGRHRLGDNGVRDGEHGLSGSLDAQASKPAKQASTPHAAAPLGRFPRPWLRHAPPGSGLVAPARVL